MKITAKAEEGYTATIEWPETLRIPTTGELISINQRLFYIRDVEWRVHHTDEDWPTGEIGVTIYVNLMDRRTFYDGR